MQHVDDSTAERTPCGASADHLRFSDPKHYGLGTLSMSGWDEVCMSARAACLTCRCTNHRDAGCAIYVRPIVSLWV